MRKYCVAKIGPIMESEIDEIPVVLMNLLNATDQFNSLAKVLNSRTIASVQILARGTSDNAAHFLKYLIEVKFGLPVGLSSPSSVTIYNSKLRLANTLVVAISQSGQSNDLIEYATAAKAAGALLVSITNDPNSPLARLGDSGIDICAGKEIAVAATKSYTAQLMACYLMVHFWLKIPYNISNFESMINESKRLVENKDLVSDVVALLNRDDEIVVLGRGFSYANARETALKIQETSKIAVQGFSIADYMHGPISSLSVKSKVIIISPNKSPSSSIPENLTRIRELGAQIIWIGSEAIAESNDLVISGCNCNDEILANIVDTIAIQRLALDFARKNGLDPDNPAGLSKITFTR
jgi:glucosamine--fructose-6-phosphate aminotransferase (isomerizing)